MTQSTKKIVNKKIKLKKKANVNVEEVQLDDLLAIQEQEINKDENNKESENII
jgi:hypothetical protein